MSEEERKAKKAAHMVEVRAQQKAAREAAAAAAAAEKEVSLQQFNDQLEVAYVEEHPDRPDDFCELCHYEWDCFRAWAAEQPNGEAFDLQCCMEFYEAWRQEGSPDLLNALLPEPSASPRARTQAAAAQPAPDDDDPDDGWGSWDCYYDGPSDHDRAEQRTRVERERRAQPGYVQLNLQAQSHRNFTAFECTVQVQLCVVNEDYNDGYELAQERWYNEDARRSHFYGVPAGDLPPSAAAPFGFELPSGVPASEPSVPQPRRDDVVLYGPLAGNLDGDRAFRRDRAMWYESIMHQPLTGTLTEQWEKADALARSFRVDNTRSGRPGPSSQQIIRHCRYAGVASPLLVVNAKVVL